MNRYFIMMFQYKNRMFQIYKIWVFNLDQSGLENEEVVQGIDIELNVKIFLDIGLVKSYKNIFF